MMRWSAGARDNKVMARGCEERWRDGTRVRGTMARWDAWARNYSAMGRVGERWDAGARNDGALGRRCVGQWRGKMHGVAWRGVA